MNELQSLREKIDNEGAKAVVDKLVSLKKSLKVWYFSHICVYTLSLVFFGNGFWFSGYLQELEKEENEVESVSNSELDAEVRELEEQIENGYDSQSLSDKLNRMLSESEEKIDLAKKVVLFSSQINDWLVARLC